MLRLYDTIQIYFSLYCLYVAILYQEKVQTGYRLTAPPDCPKSVYQILVKCW